MPFDEDKLRHFPHLPGVYLMKNHEGKILYVGKAKNLKSRIKQYFIEGRDGRTMVPFLTAQIETIDTIVVTSEKEALILENNLIKRYQPKYNALLKDDKTYFSLMINHKHKWPMIRLVRYKGKPPKGNLYFGPYTQAYAAKQTLQLLRDLFPLRQCSDHELSARVRPCILHDMKKCIAPCVNLCSKEEYGSYVNSVIKFLKGQDDVILKELKKELNEAIENLEFEKAERIHTMIGHIEKTLEQQKVQKAGLSDMDVLSIFRQGDKVVLSQIIFREGKLIAANDLLFFNNAQQDSELLSSFILQHYGNKEELPYEIVTPLEIKDHTDLESLISENKKHKTSILFPKKGNKKKFLDLAYQNAKAKFQQETKKPLHDKEQVLMEMKEAFRLTHFPERIECFDHSNISGSEPVASRVVFEGGEKDLKSYRRYRIKDANRSDDYGALKEVLERRFKRAIEEKALPDLVIIDGGKGHLNIAIEVLSSLDISTVDIIALAKEEGRHDKGLTKEKVFLPEEKIPKELAPNSPILFLLQQIRDEAHRFAITYQRKRSRKASLKSALDSIAGIGPTKKQRLLGHFGSFKRILEASAEEWAKIKGITKKDIETLQNYKNIAE